MQLLAAQSQVERIQAGYQGMVQATHGVRCVCVGGGGAWPHGSGWPLVQAYSVSMTQIQSMHYIYIGMLFGVSGLLL